MRRTSTAFALAGLAALTGITPAQEQPQPDAARLVVRRGAPDARVPDFLGWVSDELVIVLEPEARRRIVVMHTPSGEPVVSLPGLQQRLQASGAVLLRRQFPSARAQAGGSPYPDLTGHYKVRLAPESDLEAAVRELEAAPDVARVERIGMHALYNEPNDPYFKGSPNPSFPYDQWHLYDTHGVDCELAWDAQTGSDSVLVGILDSGTRYFHVDLGGNVPIWGPDAPSTAGNIFVNPGEIPGNGIDDDGNGFVDDTIGWDFVDDAGGFGVNCIDEDCDVPDNDPDDTNGHGTHTAGTVGAITNNGILVSGVAGGFGAGTGVKIVPMKIGYHARYQGIVTGVVRMDWAAEAMSYLADLVDAGHNVASINCSWGSSNSGGLGAAVNGLLARDVVIVHAAGNSNSNSADYLGSRSDVLSVAATDRDGSGASFTNHGSWVDVAAPGVEILSTYRSADDPDPNAHYIALLDGTSMAAPHVAGIVALLESCTPGLTGPQKLALVVNNTDPYSDSRDLGSGIANAKKALDAAGCGGTPCDVTADFAASQTSGCAPLAVSFTDLSSGTGISTWSWDFGDGNGSSAQNPGHQYAAPGTYTVSLTTTGSTCSDSETKAGYVTVSDVPIADFSGAPTSGTAPLTVSFTDNSSGVPTSWSWDFGDGNGSSTQNPSHQYAAPGTFTVSLTATNACGGDTNTKTGYVTVTEAGGTDDVLVFDIAVVKVNDGQGFKHAEATVTIHDGLGNPVSGALVTGDFSGKTTDVDLSGTTNGAGQVVLSSSSAKGGGEWCFEVTDVVPPAGTYQPQQNQVTQSCESGDVF